MAAVAEHDEAAFALLIDRHLKGLRSFLYRTCGNAADAEEFAQETFLRLWRQAHRWQPGRVRFTTWLYRIGRNLAIDGFRKHREQPIAVLPDAVDEGDALDTALERTRLQTRVRGAIGQLPERQRTALLLCHYQGMSNPDAALVLEVSVDALESLLSRARRTLKLTLKADIDYQVEQS